eukprot:TRINITY_DN8711_c0_g1_i1.p1 TRINITY_DN8711_c0_g1~~TRINITY_DN8711_c0_g1_i1.p1  ORF type:complete len:331 (-),score=79.28 TRINITY_DN8711_c0_g1_i1:872-1864(-)
MSFHESIEGIQIRPHGDQVKVVMHRLVLRRLSITASAMSASASLASRMRELSNAGDLRGVQALYRQNLDLITVRSDLDAFNAFMEAHVENGSLNEVLRIWSTYENSGISFDFNTYVMVIDCCVRNDDLAMAMSFFEQMMNSDEVQSRDESLYNLLIHANAKIGTSEAAEKLFEDLSNGRGRTAGLTPSRTTLVCLMGAYANHGEFEKAWNVFGQLEVIDRFAYRTLFLGLCKHGKISDLFDLKEDVKKNWGMMPDLTMFEALCESCCKHGSVDDALESYSMCLKTVPAPSEKIFQVTYDKCMQEKEVARAQFIHQDSGRYGHEGKISIKH